MTGKKMGRPTDNPKPFRIYARIDAHCKEIPEPYAAQENVTVMEAMRRAIKKLEDGLVKQ